MRLVPTVLVLSMLGMGLAAENPCTNGSFEQLGPNGFPADWEPVGQTVGVSDDAHSGRRSLRMARAAETKSRETGLNRAWKPDSGEQGKMIGRLKGGIDFWYKAVSADGAALNVHAIPMDKQPIERTGSPRVTFTVPKTHVGDGKWHHARLAYDFTDNEKARWVHFAARIVGKAGELLLDDVSYVERVGPLLAFRGVRLVEDPEQPGRRCTIKASVKNTGDSPAGDVVVSLATPPGLKLTPATRRLGALAAGGNAWARFTLEGSRNKVVSIAVTAKAGDASAEAAVRIAPKLVLESFGPISPVAAQGGDAILECVLRNPGNATILNPSAQFTLAQRTVGRNAKAIFPGERVVLTATFPVLEQTPSLEASVRVRADNVDAKLAASTSVVVAAPPVNYTVKRALRPDEFEATVGNDTLSLVFRQNDFGFGPARLNVRTGAGPRTTAWLTRLSRLVYRASDGARREQTVFARGRPTAAPGRLQFVWETRDADGADWRLTATFTAARGDRVIAADYRLTCSQPRDLLAFDGPMLYALDRDEAVFPGLEWLIGDELSSSTLDIAEGHPHQKRFVVHPNMVTIPAIGVHGKNGTVGLLWDVHQKWDGTRDHPSVLFASPDRLHNQRAHLMGLFVPTVPDFVEPNATEAAKPYPLKPGQTLRLRCHIYADGAATDALAAVDEWFRLHGYPEPTPLPHATYAGEIQFSMQAYLKSLWEPETKEWWSGKGGNPLMCRLGRQRAYVADLLVGSLLSPDAEVRRQARARADEVLGLIGGEPRPDAQRRPGRADLAYAQAGHAAGLINSVEADGGWRYNAERPGHGVFESIDYHVLGPHGADAVGLSARNAFVVLRYARIAGEPRAYDAMQATLRHLETFRVPRAAQVWEVPVHTPDILAAADAVDAYLEAYRFSGEARWLRDAVAWARRGLPFVYFWGLPDKPYLLGGSIPVFGATFYRGSWFGRPVQWNGLRYANAVLNLAEHDQSRPWRRIAELIIRSAIHQQDLEGDNIALWPDNISAIDAKKCPWVFAPRQIIRNILKLTGRDEDPATVIVGKLPERLHVTAPAKLSDAAWKDSTLSVKVTCPRGQQGVVLISNVARPAAVLLNGEAIADRPGIEKGATPGWRYDQARAYLAIRIARDGATALRVDGARFRRVDRLPTPVRRIAFDFDASAEGWTPAHDIGPVAIRGGALVAKATGADPYLLRTMLTVPAADCPALVIRMRVTAGTGAQFFWTTRASPGFSEDKSWRFAIQPDGELHTYRLSLGTHKAWQGKTITAIRLDPTAAPAAEFAIDFIRAETK